MDYEIVLSRQAEREWNKAADWIAEVSASPRAAEKWFNGFIDKLISLERMSRRCGFAREHQHFHVNCDRFFTDQSTPTGHYSQSERAASS